MPGFLEEELAAAIIAIVYSSASPGEAEQPLLSRLLDVDHKPKVLRFCLGISAIYQAGGLDSDASRAMFRRGQFCLTQAYHRSTQSLLEHFFRASDPWVSTPEFTDVLDPAMRSSGTAKARGDHPLSEQVRGRVLRIRKHKTVTFVDVLTSFGCRQIALGVDDVRLGAASLRPGDHLAAEGLSGESHSGQPTILVNAVTSHRRAELPALGTAGRRSRAHAEGVSALRCLLSERGFLEQITPTLSPEYEGGSAHPYATWVNQRHRLAFLRVTSELNLLRSISHGISRCYEIGGSFRNESHAGISTGHDEFLLAEAYAAGMDLNEMTQLTVEAVGRCAFGDDWSGSVTSHSFEQAVQNVTGVSVHDEPAVRLMLSEEVGEHAATRPYLQALQILLDKIVAPAFAGVFVLSNPPMPSSPLTAGAGVNAARRWVYVEGVDCAEAALNELDLDVLGTKLEEQHRDDSFCVPRDYSGVLAALAAINEPISGTGISMTRLIDIRAGMSERSHVL